MDTSALVATSHINHKVADLAVEVVLVGSVVPSSCYLQDTYSSIVHELDGGSVGWVSDLHGQVSKCKGNKTHTGIFFVFDRRGKRYNVFSCFQKRHAD